MLIETWSHLSEDEWWRQATTHAPCTIFFYHIRAIIFEEHELRSLQSLLRDYSSIVSRYGFPMYKLGMGISYPNVLLLRDVWPCMISNVGRFFIKGPLMSNQSSKQVSRRMVTGLRSLWFIRGREWKSNLVHKFPGQDVFHVGGLVGKPYRDTIEL